MYFSPCDSEFYNVNILQVCALKRIQNLHDNIHSNFMVQFVASSC